MTKDKNSNYMNDDEKNNDQFFIILNVLGYQDIKSLSFITEEFTVNYHLNIMNKTQENQIASMFGKSSSNLIKLLEDML